MSGNLTVSNNVSVAGSITSNTLIANQATIPNLTVSNLTVSGTTNTGTFSELTVNTLDTNTLSATTSIVSPVIQVGTKNVGTAIESLETNMTTAQTNISNLQTKTTNQSYNSTTQTTSFTGSVSIPTLNLQTQLNLNNNIVADSKTITPVELGQLDGVSSNIQTQINTNNTKIMNLEIKAQNFSAVSGTTTFGGIVSIPTLNLQSQLNLNNNIVADNKTISPVEIGRLDGVSSNIQAQIDTKSNIVNPVFDGLLTTDRAIVIESDNLGRTADVNPQGLHFQWNRSAGDGTSYFMNNKGTASGNGGFIFQRYNNLGDFIDEPFVISDSIYMNNNLQHSGKITCQNLQVNNTLSSMYYKIIDGGIYLSNLISNPPFQQGLSIGTGDGTTYSMFSQGILSWYSTAFVDTCNKAVNAIINHRTGDFFTKGKVVASTMETSNLNVSGTVNVNGEFASDSIVATNAVITNLTVSNYTPSTSFSPCHIGAWIVCINGNGIHPIFCSINDTSIYFNRTISGLYLGVSNSDYGFVVMPKFKILCYRHPGYGTAYANETSYDNTNGTGPIYITNNIRDIGAWKLFYNGTEVVITGLSS